MFSIEKRILKDLILFILGKEIKEEVEHISTTKTCSGFWEYNREWWGVVVFLTGTTVIQPLLVDATPE